MSGGEKATTPPPGDGIWLGREYSPFHQASDPLQTDALHELSSDEASESFDEDEDESDNASEIDSDDYPDEDEPAGLVSKKAKANVGSMFGALEIEGLDDESDDDDDESEGDGSEDVVDGDFDGEDEDPEHRESDGDASV